MTYLDLCQQLRQMAGISGTGPASVSGESGEMARVVAWVRQAWLDLQTAREDWPALWRPLSLSVDPGQAEVSLPDDFRRLVEGNRIRNGLRFDGGNLIYVEWSQLTPDRAEAAAPVYVSQRPDKTLVLHPAPRDGGTLEGEYFAIPQVLEENDDEPWLPRHLQEAILYQALVYYAAYEDAPEVYEDATNKVQQYSYRMANELLPDASMGGPLA